MKNIQVFRKYTFLFLVIVFIFAAYFFSQFSIQKPKDSVSSTRANIDALIKRQGPSQAYADMKKIYASYTPDEQHALSHIFGEELYSTEGLEGVRICDSMYNFGCYHGFLTKAVGERGVSVVPILDKECMKEMSEASSCQHGLGHGLMEFYGKNHLTDALNACAMSTTQPDPVAGCTSGVFMEYNVPLSETGVKGIRTSQPRSLDTKNVYAPCDTVPLQFRESCYHQLPQWWYQVLERDIARMGVLCRAIIIPVLQDRCIQGIGNIAASSADYDVLKTKELCDTLPDQKARYTCIVVASWTFKTNLNDSDKAHALCELLPENVRSKCPS